MSIPSSIAQAKRIPIIFLLGDCIVSRRSVFLTKLQLMNLNILSICIFCRLKNIPLSSGSTNVH